MKVLILVLSCVKDPYNILMQGQKETWDSIIHSSMKTIYYYGGSKTKLNGDELMVNCSDDYYSMHYKFKLTLDYVWEDDWDFIIRTNSSTYINKQRAYNFIEQNQHINYGGLINGNYITGTNILLSRSTSGILKEQIPQKTQYEFPSEDVVIGDVLRNNNYLPEDGLSLSIFNHKTLEVESADLYRCKTSINGSDRKFDVKAFNHIHKKLTE